METVTPVSLGAYYYHFRQTMRHGMVTGPRLAWYRDVVRPRILRTAPIATTDDPAAEAHVLTTRHDWLNLIWTLKSFYANSPVRYRLCIHEDGDVPPEGLDALAKHFPQARIIRRAQADAAVLPRLEATFPRCHALRTTNKLALKVFDFAHYLEADRMILLDSDLIFFRAPQVLLDRVADPNYLLNTLNRDLSSAYTVEPADVQARLGFHLHERINSGFGLLHRPSLDFQHFEEFLDLPGIVGHFWRIEQTLLALASSRHGYEHLPEDYDVDITRTQTAQSPQPMRHYIGRIRHLMFLEGMRLLVNDGLLKRLGR